MSWENDLMELMNRGKSWTAGIQLAVMTGPTSCKIGNMLLSGVDLLFSDFLLTAKCTNVNTVAPAEGGTCTDKSTYLSSLKAGDIVAVYQLSDTQFLVLGRMVSA